jgi:hypothetical protein
MATDGWAVEFLNDIAEAEFDQLPIEIKAKIVRISQLIEQVGLFSVKVPYVYPVKLTQSQRSAFHLGSAYTGQNLGNTCQRQRKTCPAKNKGL